MFRVILSLIICTLLVSSPIALKLHVLRQAESRELPTDMRREEIAVARPEMSWRGRARAASQYELPGHELPIVLAGRTLGRAEARVRRERATRPLPDVAEHLLHSSCPWGRGPGSEAIEVQEVTVHVELLRRHLPLRLAWQPLPAPRGERVRLEVADMRDRGGRINRLETPQRRCPVLAVARLPVEWMRPALSEDFRPAFGQPQ